MSDVFGPSDRQASFISVRYRSICGDCNKPIAGQKSLRCRACAAAFKRDPAKRYRERPKAGNGLCAECNESLSDPRSRHCKPCRDKALYQPICGVCFSDEPKRRTPGGKLWCPSCARINTRQRWASATPEQRTRLFKGRPETLRKTRLRGKLKRRSIVLVGSHTEVEWQAIIAKQKRKCAHCRLKRKMTRDHITPLSKGGTDYAYNIQALCLSCNCSKRDSMCDVDGFSLFDRQTA